jgi:hypothetical protein
MLRGRWTSRCGLLVALALVPAVALAAPAGKPQHKSASGPDVSLGYSYTHAGEASLNGWQLDGTFPVAKSLRVVFDLNGHYGSFAGADLSQLGFFAGPRRVFHAGRLVPFAEALLGIERRTASAGGVHDSHTDWGFALGGGADYRLSGPWAIRLEADLLLLRAVGSWDTDPRVSLLAAYRFGRR